jgi:hypothetical protein
MCPEWWVKPKLWAAGAGEKGPLQALIAITGTVEAFCNSRFSAAYIQRRKRRGFIA